MRAFRKESVDLSTQPTQEGFNRLLEENRELQKALVEALTALYTATSQLNEATREMRRTTDRIKMSQKKGPIVRNS